MPKMKVLDLFSGIGGFSLGLERAGMETIAFCEFEEHAQLILKKHWPDVPIFEDVRTLDGTQFRGSVDVVCGGFPCQDLSQAGQQKGFDGERSSLYREMLRVISECLPKYAIFENVTGLITGDNGGWFAKFLYDLAEVGYDAEWHCISAAYVGAVHNRDRIWVIAHANEVGAGVNRKNGVKGNENRNAQSSERERKAISSTSIGGSETPFFADAKIAHHLKQQVELRRGSENFRDGFDITEPPFRGANDGVSRRMDRLRLQRLGNSVVPQIPQAIGMAIMAQQAMF